MTPLADLVSLLADHRAASDDESAHLDAHCALTRVDGDPFMRTHFAPGHFTASGFVTHRGRLLLIHHRRLGRWLQPGGHIDPGETVIEAARREIMEETGVNVGEPVGGGIFDVDVHPIPAGKGEPDHMHLDVRFHFEALTDDVVMSDEVNDVRWVALDVVAGFSTDDSIGRAVAKLRRQSA